MGAVRAGMGMGIVMEGGGRGGGRGRGRGVRGVVEGMVVTGVKVDMGAEWGRLEVARGIWRLRISRRGDRCWRSYLGMD